MYVSSDTAKNPQAVRQHGVRDLAMTNIRSFRIIFPYLSIGRSDHKQLYAASATFVLSLIKQSQLYVNINSWQMQPVIWNAKVTRLPKGVSSYDRDNSSDRLRRYYLAEYTNFQKCNLRRIKKKRIHGIFSTIKIPTISIKYPSRHINKLNSNTCPNIIELNTSSSFLQYSISAWCCWM